MKKTLKILLYISLVFAVLFGIGLLILSTLKGNSPEWKKQVEEIGTGIFKRKITVGDLHEARLFPEMSFDGEFVVAAAVEEDLSRGIKASRTVMIRKLQFAVPFWSIFRGRPVMRHFLLEGLAFVGVNDFVIEKIFIETPDGETPKLRIKGEHKVDAFDVSLELEKVGQGYTLVKDSELTLLIGGAEVTGIVTPNSQAFNITPMQYTYQGQELQGEFSLSEEDGFHLFLERQAEVFVEAQATGENPESSEEAIKLSDIPDPLLQNILQNFCRAIQLQYVEYSSIGQNGQLLMCYEDSEIPLKDHEIPVLEQQETVPENVQEAE